MSARLSNRSTIILVVAIIAAALALNPFGSASATHQPADKIAVSGSGLETMSLETLDEDSAVVSLAVGTLRASSPTDLIIEVTAECAIWTNVTTVGNMPEDGSEAFAQVKVWVELNGDVVPVASDDTNDAGKVVFCNRAYKRNTSMLDDNDATIETFLRTRSSNAFNWITLNVGNGIHTIEVKAQLDRVVEGFATADAAVGKRTLVVQPVKLANDAEI